jgi:hypothetical protein
MTDRARFHLDEYVIPIFFMALQGYFTLHAAPARKGLESTVESLRRRNNR